MHTLALRLGGVRGQLGCYGRSRSCHFGIRAGCKLTGMVSSKIHTRLLAFVVVAELILGRARHCSAAETARNTGQDGLTFRVSG